MITHILISFFITYGLTVLFVEKGDEYPVNLIKKPISIIFFFIDKRSVSVFDCMVCFSFWASLISELCLYFFVDNSFLWPLTGFISVGIIWTIIQVLNIFDKEEVGDNSEEGI